MSETSWIQKLWPVKRFELKKVIPLLVLKFLASLIYSLLTCMKDTLVVTAKHSGAEVIPILKGWIVFPLTIITAIVYSKLSNYLKPSTLFYSMISFFMVVILLYGFVLYPNFDTLSPHASADWLTARLGENYSHWVAVYRNWVHSIFFVTAELWAQVVIFLLFWGFTNLICRVSEAKRIYTLCIASGDLAALLAGPIILYCLKQFSGADFTPTLQTVITYVVICGALMIATYWWLNHYVLRDKRYYDPSVTKQSINQKTKLSLRQSIKHIFSSKYLLSIAVLVIGCALTINMVEVTWKARLKELYPNPIDYQAYIAKVVFFVGSIGFITALFLGGNWLRRFGWNFSAQIAPIVIGLSGSLFFLFSYFQNALTPITALFGITPLAFVVFFGAFQNMLSKVVKYSFFDSTKEIAYIPLDQESKVKGKAAIDMVGSRFGKSSSSWVQLVIMALAGTGSVLVITPYLIPIVIGMALFWCNSVRYIAKELEKHEEERQPESEPAEQPVNA
ncbi:MAG: ADP,ATP carrier protein 1 [Chlamydiales bacterium]|nr:ADP,ATP carrier protein 1 [Chlamydiales bacterium]MCH9620022.1 ADP,ATP carrier protein 1 [Chlamydiales bacterium]MCH9622875.1 ADP,ATP carrier protein 1 [Chlamydiales bacterium]